MSTVRILGQDLGLDHKGALDWSRISSGGSFSEVGAEGARKLQLWQPCDDARSELSPKASVREVRKVQTICFQGDSINWGRPFTQMIRSSDKFERGLCDVRGRASRGCVDYVIPAC